jgi:hypothetical protein
MAHAVDALGRKIALTFDMQFPNGYAIASLKTSGLSAGVYQIQAITTGNKTYTTRLIKE